MSNDTTLGARYTALVKRRPELGVKRCDLDGNEWTLQPLLLTDGWVWQHAEGVDGLLLEYEAETRIMRWFIEALPIGVAVRHCTPSLWACGNVCSFGRFQGDTPLAALLAFWEAHP